MNKLQSSVKSFNFDQSQTFWELAIIQATGLGLPVMLIGSFLSLKYGAAQTFSSLIISNLFLWIIGLSVLQTSFEKRYNGIQNIGILIGKIGEILAALILAISFIGWYSMQISYTAEAVSCTLNQGCSINQNEIAIFGAFIGFIAALGSMGGIKLIKLSSKIAFPLLILSVVVFVISAESKSFVISDLFRPSLSAVAIGMLIILPGVVNIPTFFRHSKSKADSILGFTLTTLLITIFESIFVFFPVADVASFIQLLMSENSFLMIPIIVFSLISYFVVNMMNIYLASTVMELLIPNFVGRREFLIIGTLGTTVYVFTEGSMEVSFTENLMTNFIGILGIVFIINQLTSSLTKHFTKNIGKIIGLIIWIVSCGISWYYLYESPEDSVQSLVAGSFSCVILFVIIYFFTELYWSYNEINNNKKKS